MIQTIVATFAFYAAFTLWALVLIVCAATALALFYGVLAFCERIAP